jgi:hypothetical protein
MTARQDLRDELVAAALSYGAAQAKYHVEWERRPPESVKHEGWTDVQFDEAQMAAVHAMHAARERMEHLAEKLHAAETEEAQPLSVVDDGPEVPAWMETRR